jgi:hypothetical protein
MSEQPGESRARRQLDVLLWVAPLVAIVGFVSYWGYFVRWPFLRDTGLLNLALLLLASGLALLGLRRAWPRGRWRRLAGVAGVIVSTALTGLFIAYCYVISYGLPPTDGVVALGERLPEITLASYDGTPVDLARASEGPGPLVLVFYRGFW